MKIAVNKIQKQKTNPILLHECNRVRCSLLKSSTLRLPLHLYQTLVDRVAWSSFGTIVNRLFEFAKCVRIR